MEIARARNCILKGGEPDYSRAAKLLIDDFRGGRLGRDHPGASGTGRLDMKKRENDYEEDREIRETLRRLEEMPDEVPEPSRLQEVLSFLAYAALVFGITFLIITFVGQRTKVSRKFHV